jgi:hypothetical protein
MNNNNWGPATWALLHTIAAKIKPTVFFAHKHIFIHLIKTICNTLPCETCAQHASLLLSNYNNYHKIISIKDYQIFLWEFHNIINIKLNKQEKSKDILENYYKNNLYQLLQFWNTKYVLSVSSAYQLKHSININNTRRYINNFITNNKHLFI